MTRAKAVPFLLLALTACVDGDAAPTATTTAELSAACNAPMPPARAWNGVVNAPPGGDLTLVLYRSDKDPTTTVAYFVDRNGGKVYDRVNVKSQQLGALVGGAASIDQDLAVLGTPGRPLPRPNPPPGQDATFMLLMADGFKTLQSDAGWEAAACEPGW